MQEWSRHFKKERVKKVNYENWDIGLKLGFQWMMEWIGIAGFLAYFFYRSYWAMVLLLPGIWFYTKEKKKKIFVKRKKDLEQQFKETLMSVQTNLQSGYSLENAFLESYSYIVDIYGSNCDMAQELLWIQRGIANGEALECLLWDLGKRCPESIVEDFANVYAIAHKMGNGWTEIIMKIIDNMNQQMEIKQEIEILIHGKKMESRIMCIVPFFILFYMNLTSKGYFSVLYHNPGGILIMSVCLGGYLFAFLMSERITEV